MLIRVDMKLYFKNDNFIQLLCYLPIFTCYLQSIARKNNEVPSVIAMTLDFMTTTYRT